MKDGGKSYYQKLRRVMYLLYYYTEYSETLFENHFSAKLAKIRKSGFSDLLRINSPGLPGGPPGLGVPQLLPADAECYVRTLLGKPS